MSSDSGPDPVHAKHVPYAESGGALILSWDDAVPGFVAHRTTTYAEFEALAQGYWEWEPRPRLRPSGPAGHNTLVVMEKPGYHDRAVDCAVETAEDFLTENGVVAKDVDLLIATHAPGFADTVADRLGIPHSKVVHVGEDMADAHTAEPVAAIATAMRDGRWADAKTTLLVAACAGISVAVSLYRQ